LANRSLSSFGDTNFPHDAYPSWGASKEGEILHAISRKKLLASLDNSSDANCDAQPMPRSSFAQTTLVRPCSAFVCWIPSSRTLSIVTGRTRMSGGVGRAVSDGGPYPIYPV